MAYSIKIDDEKVSKALDDLEAATGNVKGPMQTIGRKILNRVLLGFRTSATPWGAPWAPLKHRDGRPLRDTNRLQSSMTYRIGGDKDSQHVDIGTNVAYAPVHQFGTTIKIPARSQRIYKKLLKSGNLANGGKFVKKGKSNFAQNVTLPAYQIVIPARPFLPIKSSDLELPVEWESDVVNAIVSHLKREGALI